MSTRSLVLCATQCAQRRASRNQHPCDAELRYGVHIGCGRSGCNGPPPYGEPSYHGEVRYWKEFSMGNSAQRYSQRLHRSCLRYDVTSCNTLIYLKIVDTRLPVRGGRAKRCSPRLAGIRARSGTRTTRKLTVPSAISLGNRSSAESNRSSDRLYRRLPIQPRARRHVRPNGGR